MQDHVDGAPRVVLALHCSLAHGGAWSGVARHLKGVSMLAPDLPGHGAQRLWDGRSDLHADSTRLAIGLAEDRGQVDLVGHSFGATVALRVAMERPELVRSLVLVEPVLFCAARSAGSAAFRPFVEDHRDFSAAVAVGRLEHAARHFMAQWGDGTDWNDLPERQRTYITERIAQVAAQDAVLLEDAAGLLVWMRLEALGVPVLLVEGAESPPIIGAIQSALSERLPQVTRKVLAGAGHMSVLTHPQAVAEAIAAHLLSCGASA
jgi:lipase